MVVLFLYEVYNCFGLGEQVVELDLKTVVPCCSGPKRPQDKVAVSDMKKDFESCLGAKVRPLDSACALGSRLSQYLVVDLPEAWCQGHFFSILNASFPSACL